MDPAAYNSQTSNGFPKINKGLINIKDRENDTL